MAEADAASRSVSSTSPTTWPHPLPKTSQSTTMTRAKLPDVPSPSAFATKQSHSAGPSSPLAKVMRMASIGSDVDDQGDKAAENYKLTIPRKAIGSPVSRQGTPPATPPASLPSSPVKTTPVLRESRPSPMSRTSNSDYRYHRPEEVGRSTWAQTPRVAFRGKAELGTEPDPRGKAMHVGVSPIQNSPPQFRPRPRLASRSEQPVSCPQLPEPISNLRTTAIHDKTRVAERRWPIPAHPIGPRDFGRGKRESGPEILASQHNPQPRLRSQPDSNPAPVPPLHCIQKTEHIQLSPTLSTPATPTLAPSTSVNPVREIKREPSCLRAQIRAFAKQAHWARHGFRSTPPPPEEGTRETPEISPAGKPQSSSPQDSNEVTLNDKTRPGATPFDNMLHMRGIKVRRKTIEGEGKVAELADPVIVQPPRHRRTASVPDDEISSEDDADGDDDTESVISRSSMLSSSLTSNEMISYTTGTMNRFSGIMRQYNLAHRLITALQQLFMMTVFCADVGVRSFEAFTLYSQKGKLIGHRERALLTRDVGRALGYLTILAFVAVLSGRIIGRVCAFLAWILWIGKFFMWMLRSITGG